MLSKLQNSEFTFDDGLVMSIPESQPQHIQFWCKTSDPDAESCNLRLFKLAKEQSEEAQSSRRVLDDDESEDVCKHELPFNENER